MKTFIITLTVLLYSAFVYAAPYKCGVNGVVFADESQCAAACGTIKCDELIAGGSNSGNCDANYQGFFGITGKTYAVTKSPVEWHSVKPATIRNGLENELISQMLLKYGVSQAWIGANDPLKSADYDIVDKQRFKWRDNATITYDNWASGQPDNMLDATLIGVAPHYGQYWGVMDSSGKWSDVGLAKDGNPQRIHAVVEFSGELACVAGKSQSSSLPSGMYCSDNVAGADDLVSLDKCETGIVFGSTDTANLCPKGKTACIKTTETIPGAGECRDEFEEKQQVFDDSMPFIGGNKNEPTYLAFNQAVVTTTRGAIGVVVHDYTDKLEGEFVSSKLIVHPYIAHDTYMPGFELTTPIAGFPVSPQGIGNFSYTLTVTVKIPKTVCDDKYIDSYTCPLTGRPCIESAGDYYCSPYNCLDSVTGGTSSEETEEGENDDNNNGEYDDDGNCMGQIIIFPGKDMRCRLPSALTAFVGCCHEMTLADADKPDIRLSKEQVMGGIYGLYLIGGPAYLWLMSLASIIDINICNGNEKQLGVNRGLDQCKYVGKYCSKKWDSQGCVQMKDTWCCFDSEFTRAFAEAGHDLLGKSWGTPENPLCSGFTPEELQQLSAMGISDHPVMKAFAENLGAQYSEKLMKEFKNNLSPTLEQDIKKEIEGMKE